MKIYEELKRYPLGAIKAEGFLKEQLERGKSGMAGNLYKLEPEMIRDPFIKRSYVPAWTDGNQEGWGAEISGNFWTGYIQHAFVLDDEEMKRIATEWVDAVLLRQRPDGYLGTYCEDGCDIYDDYNAWGTACGMRGLLAFYEATGRADVLNAVHACMLWFVENWAGDKKTCYAGPFIIEPMIFTYYLTGDERLVKFSEEYLDFITEHDYFSISYKKMLTDEYHYNSNHTAGIGTTGRLPALVYTATGKREYLDATINLYSKILAKSVHLSGGPVSVTEYLGPVGATTETEYCSFAFYNATYSYLSAITGDPVWGDRMEEMFYNGAEGARKKDERAIAYLTAPNQIFATMDSSANFGDMQVYAPCYTTSCCPVNAVAVVPEFIRGLLLTDEDGGVYATAYGPCSLDFNGVKLEERTLYPFRNKVAFDIRCDKRFSLNLKIPAWAQSYKLTVCGEAQTVAFAAEMARKRRYEPDRTFGIGEGIVPSRPPSDGFFLSVERFKLGKAFRTSTIVDYLQELFARHDILLAPPRTIRTCRRSYRHVLDEAYVKRSVDGQLGKPEEILVEAAHRHGIDLDRVEAGLESRIDTFERRLYLPHARYECELIRIERVEGNVHA